MKEHEERVAVVVGAAEAEFGALLLDVTWLRPGEGLL